MTNILLLFLLFKAKFPFMMMKILFRMFLFALLFFAPLSLHALDLSGSSTLQKGESQLKLSGGMLFGVLSPQATFTHASGLNSARMYTQTVSFSHGFGDHGLKDCYLEVESLTFQSRRETVNGAAVHTSDAGWALTARGGANFIHNPKFVFGGWLQTSVPVIMDKKKFVNPVINYIGGGLHGGGEFSKGIGASQSLFLGSGLFSPKKRNPNMRSTTLGVFNFGRLFWDRDVSFSTGGIIEADLTSRIDTAYQTSTLADGRIQNFVFMTPFIFNISLGKGWRIEAAHAAKWLGKSSRGSQFTTLSVAKVF